MMAAGRAAACGERVVLLEKNSAPGRKLLITGGGRCNITNAETRRHVLVEKYGPRGKFLHSLFARFGPSDVRDFFHSYGLETRVEDENRVFPVTDQARSVLDVLLRFMQEGAVAIRTGVSVENLEAAPQAGGQRTIAAARTSAGRIEANRFVVATGGTSHPETGSTGDGYRWLRELGHAVRESEASLVPILVREKTVTALQGLALADVRLTAVYRPTRPQDGVGSGESGPRLTERGKLLFTHFGLSGPLVLNMSSEISNLERRGRSLHGPGNVAIELDLVPSEDHARLDRRLLDAFAEAPNRKIKNTLQNVVPARLGPLLLAASGMDAEKPAHGVTREERKNLVSAIKCFRLTFTGLLGKRHAVVTSGGVSLEEVDFRTMRSLLYENLYLAGDILDFQRRSGGYSLQICWASGWVSGSTWCS